MNRIAKTFFFLFAVSLASVPAHGSLAELGSVTPTITTREGGYSSAIIDTTNGFAYFGSSVPFGVAPLFSYISSIEISPLFAYSAGSTFFRNLTYLRAAIFDPTTGFSYWANSGTTSGLQKIHLTNPVSASSVTLNSAESLVRTGVIDTASQFGYFGTQSSPSLVLKIRLSDLAIISTITLPSPLDFVSASVIDTQNGFAYFGGGTGTGAVAKIRLSDFTLTTTLTFNSGEGGVASAAIDVANEYAYFGTNDSPGKVVRVRLVSLTHNNVLTLKSGQNNLTSALIDPARAFAYFGTHTSSGIVIPIYLTTFTEEPVLSLGAGEDFLTSAVIDTTNEYAYFGTFTTPGHIAKIDLQAGPPEILSQPVSATTHIGETALFAIVADGRNITYRWQINGVDIPGANSAVYARVITLTDDGATFRCVVTGTNGTTISNSALFTIIPLIRAYPNPWRADRHGGTNITFDGLLPNSTVKIFNLAAHWAKTLPAGATTWDLTNDAGEMVASGYYFYLVTTHNDQQTTHGKLLIIR